MFTSKFPLVSKRQTQLKIEAVGVREKRPGDARQIWHIRDEFLPLINEETKAYLDARPVFVSSEPASASKRGGSKRKAAKKKHLDEYEDMDDYDVTMGPPKDAKKAFTHFCNATRKDVKAALSEDDRKNKDLVNSQLSARWERLTDNELRKWKYAQEKDERRYLKQNALWEKACEAEERAAAAKRRKKGPIVYGRPVVVQVQVGGEKLVGRTHASVGGPEKPEEVIKKEQEAAAAAAAAAAAGGEAATATATTTTTSSAVPTPALANPVVATPAVVAAPAVATSVAPPAQPVAAMTVDQAAPPSAQATPVVAQPLPTAPPPAAPSTAPPTTSSSSAVPPAAPQTAPTESAGMKREREEDTNGNGFGGDAQTATESTSSADQYHIPKKKKH
jgi:hypothetical protein